ncbi:MAG: S1C family serine protease [Planctomycetota bacterium]
MNFDRAVARLVILHLTVGVWSTSLAVRAQGSAYAFEERRPRSALEQLVDAKIRSVVKVHGASGLKGIDPYASGVIVSAEGHILTLDQVMIQAGQTRVVLADGSTHLAELLPPEPRLGVRLLKIDPTALKEPLLPLVPASEAPSNGRVVISIGNAFRLAEFSEKMTVVQGVVSGIASSGLRYKVSDVDYDGRLILTDAPNNPGHGGGALITLDGSFVGLNSRTVESTETNTILSAAIPVCDLRSYLDRWVREIVTSPSVGADPTAEPRSGHHGIVLFDRGGRRSPPAYIDRVQPNSPAAGIGLHRDDLIVRIGDRAIRSCAEFEREMAKHRAGETVRILYKRGDSVQQVDLTLGEGK